MECRFIRAGRLVFQRGQKYLFPSDNLMAQKLPCVLFFPHAIKKYTASRSARHTASHTRSTSQERTTLLNGSDSSQAYPLSGYYHDILHMHSPYRHQTTQPHPIYQQPANSSAVAAAEPQSPQERMAIVFGTRLAGPGRSSRYNQGTMSSESIWKTVNGVAIPPRPEEPDNCCMSGCVHCVWDDFRDEMEEWAARLQQAKAQGSSANTAAELRHVPRSEVASASTSMDDDGGGSDTNWAVSNESDDLFANIPVGIREFMKTEKKLKMRHQEDTMA